MTSHSVPRLIRAAIVLLASFAAFAPRAAAQTIKIDDGTPGYSLSYAFADDFCWLNRLSVPAPTTLTSLEITFGQVPSGTPVSLCVWRDLGGYGDPNQALLVTRVNTVVRNGGQQLMTQYPIPPTQVSGMFFVGAFLTTNGSWSPATMDPHTPNLGRSWFCTAYGPGTFDPNFLGSWSLWNVATLGIQGVFMIRANGASGPTPETYCVAKTNSLGCVPTLALSGTPSAGAGSGFTLTAGSVLNQRSGLLLYGLSGVQMAPFGGGTLCVRPPLRRTAAQVSGGSPTGNDCSGTYVFDFNAWIAAGSDPALAAGVTVDAQFWSRDPGFAAPGNIGLTKGAHFGIAP